MQLTPDQTMVLVGIITSIAISIAKMIKKYDASATIWKLAPAILTPILLVGFAKQWQLDQQALFDMLTGVLSALGTYGAISRPLKLSMQSGSTSA